MSPPAPVEPVTAVERDLQELARMVKSLQTTTPQHRRASLAADGRRPGRVRR